MFKDSSSQQFLFTCVMFLLFSFQLAHCMSGPTPITIGCTVFTGLLVLRQLALDIVHMVRR